MVTDFGFQARAPPLELLRSTTTKPPLSPPYPHPAMDRLKNISSSVKSRIPGQEPKTSYSGYSDSRTHSARPSRSNTTEQGAGITDRLGGKLTQLAHRATGKESAGEEERVARPITALKDPNSFAPPPKHRSAYGDDVAKASISPPTGSAPPLPPPTPRRATAADGARAPPPVPPRLPPRRNTTDVTEEDLHERGGLSAGAASAMGRLGRAGISVPGFETKKVDGDGHSPASSNHQILPPPPRSNIGSIGAIGNRFSKPSISAAVPTTGTTMAEKQAAVKTANQFYKDPSKVSFSDARAAASTARNFQQRHGEQVADGIRAGNELKDKHGEKVSQGLKYGTELKNRVASAPPDAHRQHTPPPPPRRNEDTHEAEYAPPPPPRRTRDHEVVTPSPPPPHLPHPARTHPSLHRHQHRPIPARQIRL